MDQIRFFKGVESELGALQTDINTWLAESGVTVKQVFGNIAAQTMRHDQRAESTRQYPPSDVLVAVLYEQG
ncbi:MAG: hypothetical protein HKO59_08995 [Phycisphaerales bacterium]|nr:hypothetical protein [Phycisphaerae bacterium]NNF42772.1 hypothetical protein [Phycisphaerales bacterium]NNM26105.1 hypothetical protein [Phycisphaerales bacterium]